MNIQKVKSSSVSTTAQNGDSKTNILVPCNLFSFNIVELLTISMQPLGT